MPLPFEFLCDLTKTEIVDICFLNGSWPFINQHPGLATLTCDGVCKITTIDGKLLHSFEVNHKANSLTSTPEQYKPVHSSSSSSFRSSILIGGEYLSSYSPESSSYDKVLSRLNYLPTSVNNPNLNNNTANNYVIQDYFSQIHNFSANLSNSISSSALNTLPTTISTHSFPNHLTNTNLSNQLNNNRRNNLINTIDLNLPNSISKLKYGN